METPAESQPTYASPSKEDFYIEYSEKIENDENVYTLYLSFHSSKNAEEYLEKVKKWQLPFEIDRNRITLLPTKELDVSHILGVSSYRVNDSHSSDFEDFIYIVFSSDEDAFEFYQGQSYNFELKEGDAKNDKPKIILHDVSPNSPKPFNHCVSFKKTDLIPFVIDKRAAETLRMTLPMVRLLFLLKEINVSAQFPSDIFQYIMEQTWELMNGVIEPYLKEFVLLTQFKINHTPKTECFIESSPALDDFGGRTPSFYLRTEDESLFQKMDKNTRLPLQLKNSGNTIEIGPCIPNMSRYGSFYYPFDYEINIKFKSEYELSEFLKYVTLFKITKDNLKVKMEYVVYKNVLHLKEKDLNLHEYENKIRAIFRDIDLIIDTVLVARDNESNREKEIRLQQMACFNQLKILVRQGIYAQKAFGKILLDWLKSTTDLIPRGKIIENVIYLTRDGTFSHQAETYLQIQKLENTYKSSHDVSFRTLLSQMRFG